MSIIIHWKIHGFAHRALLFVLVVFKKVFCLFQILFLHTVYNSVE